MQCNVIWICKYEANVVNIYIYTILYTYTISYIVCTHTFASHIAVCFRCRWMFDRRLASQVPLYWSQALSMTTLGRMRTTVWPACLEIPGGPGVTFFKIMLKGIWMSKDNGLPFWLRSEVRPSCAKDIGGWGPVFSLNPDVAYEDSLNLPCSFSPVFEQRH